MRRVILAAALLCFGAVSGVAQQARGTVSDSATKRPLPGTVLLLLDSAGNVLGRNITNERGQYTIALTGAMRRIRAQRIGFRPREGRIPPTPTGVVDIDIAMPAIPTFLEPVRVTASACARRSDQGSALALLEQARAGLLATVVAREAKPGALTLLMFDRTMEGTSDRIERQSVKIDSSQRSAVSFSAVHDAAAFVRRGFMEDHGDGQTFYAPDADVLLSDAFAAGYCFRLMDADRKRPNQVGLGFVAADRRRDRVDIEGALWVDTAARALRDIEFRYAGLDSRILQLEPGGRIAFREMANGLVLVDQWTLRLVGARHDTVPASRRDKPIVDLSFYGHENGGELAHAKWPDGTTWHAPLGAVEVKALRRDGRPASGIRALLLDTPYRAVADSGGRFAMSDLIPGPYSLAVADPDLRAVQMTIPTELWFMSKRDTARFVVKVPTLDEYVIDRCVADRSYRYGVTDTTRVLARVMAPNGKPIGDVQWSAAMSLHPEDASSPWITLREGGRTGSDGVIALCQRGLARDATVEIVVWREGMQRLSVKRKLGDRVNVVPIFAELKP